MIERVIYTPEAETDVAESYDWYEACELGLGEDFRRCVEACVLSIQRHPQLYPVTVDEFRRALVRRFPFEIFYEVGDELYHHLFHLSLFATSAEVAVTPRLAVFLV